ncbi:hypothetical protein GCM10009839_38920 [Catenulispora yoronensis]|uniref:Terminase small subunit n=1 Tax=Catenulispora yoronensis TaxID=450799 RepID=A0ABN2UCK3_9ACTN
MAEDTHSRGNNGKFCRGIAGAERDAQAAHLRAQGLSYRQVAEALGYADASGAFKSVQRALSAVPAEAVAELRAVEAARLDELTRRAWAVVDKTHLVVAANGRVVEGPDGQPLIDDAPTLHALDRLLKIAERRARLFGLDAAKKYEVRQQVVTLDAIDAAIADLRRQLDEYPAPDVAEER